MKKAVLFDVDGTLLDAYDFIFEAVKYTLLFHNHPYPADKKIKQAMGKSLVEFYKVLFPRADPLILAQTHHKFQHDKFHQVKPFPKASETLQKLKSEGFLIAAVSNRTREGLKHSLKLAEIFDYFNLIVSAEDVTNPKPHKEHLLFALREFKVKPANAFMVGDTDNDIQAGKNAGTKTVGVTYGFLGNSIKDYNPDFVIDKIEELLKVLK